MVSSENIAFYLRLSQEDFDTGKLKEESDSIGNQRKLLYYYVNRRKELKDCRITEYCDDGYTGTNFDRPGFQQLLKDTACGRIDTIVLKDYSRLGRNFIGVGRYLEEEFPQMQIRVISVNDGYDSNHVVDTATSINIPIRNLMNDFYVKDLSKKVKSGITARQKKGECISANAIFGYRKSEADIHKFAIDEETAPIVKQIFDYALAGYHGVEIANMLNHQQIKTPAWFKNKSDRRNYEIDEMTGWTSAKVMKIIRDQRYAGDMVGNVRVTTKIAKTDNIRVDRENWIIVENTHEPIVSKELFFNVNEKIMPRKEREKLPLGENRRRGFCLCPHCGRVLQKSNTSRNTYFFCSNGRYRTECKDIKIAEKDLNAVLSVLLVKQIGMLVDVETFIKRNKLKVMAEQKSVMSGADIDKQILKLKQSNAGIYERYRTEKMNKEEYLIQKLKLKEKIEELEKGKMKMLNGIGAKREQESWEQRLREKIERFKNQTVFSDRDYAKLIESVKFVDDVTVKVRWKFMDQVNTVLRYLLIMEKRVG